MRTMKAKVVWFNNSIFTLHILHCLLDVDDHTELAVCLMLMNHFLSCSFTLYTYFVKKKISNWVPVGAHSTQPHTNIHRYRDYVLGQKTLNTVCLLHSKQTLEFLSHARMYTHREIDLIKNWSASCCVSLLCWGIHHLFAMHCCVSPLLTQTQYVHTSGREGVKPHMSNTLSLRVFQRNTPMGEILKEKCIKKNKKYTEKRNNYGMVWWW